jgi:hypothetical protein
MLLTSLVLLLLGLFFLFKSTKVMTLLDKYTNVRTSIKVKGIIISAINLVISIVLICISLSVLITSQLV